MILAQPMTPSLHVKGTTKLVGIFGDPVTYTLSPRMHNSVFSELHLDFVYVPFQVREKDLKKAVEAIRSLQMVGVNVTIPHKQTVIPYLDEISPLAQKIGAVNTIVHRNGRLVGHNTDAPGFLTSLREDGPFDPENKRAVLLGSGGTAHAISVALLDAGIQNLVILNRTLERAQELVRRLKKSYGSRDISAESLSVPVLKKSLERADILLNATPTGIDSLTVPIPTHLFVFDAVYAKVTPLLTLAKQAGAVTLGGLGMLVHQGALSFSLWTGLEPPVQLMKKSLEANHVE
ncbi:MAG: shikimate dehydrogenase [Elusimicrobia bacterium]|nr:shikimate dehydrogenase [Elusimicrobiota bacterium]